ncbi:MAG: DUF4157 domain-containing protein, partial [Haloarculaceae archaeon]
MRRQSTEHDTEVATDETAGGGPTVDGPARGREGKSTLARLQRARGNQAVQALAEHGVQPKLTVDAPDTPAEREADRVADEVMRMPTPNGETDHGQREQAVEESVSRPSIGRRASTGASDTAVSGELEARINRLKSGGQSLSAATRSYFEPRFGADFGDVNVHTGPRAQRAAESVNAKAFAHGTDLVFGRGVSPGVNRTMAHELAHVRQQTSPDIQRTKKGRGKAAKKGRNKTRPTQQGKSSGNQQEVHGDAQYPDPRLLDDIRNELLTKDGWMGQIHNSKLSKQGVDQVAH